jgi:hypothetical protein
MAETGGKVIDPVPATTYGLKELPAKGSNGME